MVAAANPHAVAAAIEMLEKGGHAVDAAIAAHAVLGLVEPQSSGLGGGAFMLGGWRVLCYMLDEEFGDFWHTALKLAAIYLLIHTARLVMLSALDLQMPGGGFVVAGLAAIGLAMLLAIIFVIIPAVLMFWMVSRLLDLQLYELFISTLGLWVAHNFAFIIIKSS